MSWPCDLRVVRTNLLSTHSAQNRDRRLDLMVCNRKTLAETPYITDTFLGKMNKTLVHE